LQPTINHKHAAYATLRAPRSTMASSLREKFAAGECKRDAFATSRVAFASERRFVPFSRRSRGDRPERAHPCVYAPPPRAAHLASLDEVDRRVLVNSLARLE
jgi:hypothetical protein